MTIIDIITRLRALQRYDVVVDDSFMFEEMDDDGEYIRWHNVDELIEQLEKVAKEVRDVG